MILKNIWHSANEKPDNGSTIITTDGVVGLYECEGGRDTIYCPAGHVEFLGHHGKWNMRWAYASDALAVLSEINGLKSGICALMEYIDIQAAKSSANNYDDTAVAFRQLGDYVKESLGEYVKDDRRDTE